MRDAIASSLDPIRSDPGKKQTFRGDVLFLLHGRGESSRPRREPRVRAEHFRLQLQRISERVGAGHLCSRAPRSWVHAHLGTPTSECQCRILARAASSSSGRSVTAPPRSSIIMLMPTTAALLLLAVSLNSATTGGGARSARHLKYMSFYSGCNATAASELSGWSNLCLTGNLTNLQRAKTTYGIDSALYLMDAQNMLVGDGCYQFDHNGTACTRDPAISTANGWGIYRRPPAACAANVTCLLHWDGLAPRWHETIMKIISTTTAHGITMDAILLADEICDAGIPVANLSTVASFVRSLVGPKVVLWTNEGVSAFTKAAWQPSLITKVPHALDMISVDNYVTPGSNGHCEWHASIPPNSCGACQHGASSIQCMCVHTHICCAESLNPVG